MNVPPILTELTADLADLPRYPNRLRIAVSPAEYETVRAYMLDTYGEFYGRILNIPLVVDPSPKAPQLLIETRE